MSAPMPIEVLAPMLREYPPHRAPDAFFERMGAWRRKAADGAKSRVERVAASLAAADGSAAYAQADLLLVRSLYVAGADELGALLALLRERWPAPGPARAATIGRVTALVELAKLREAGAIPPAAASRMAWLLDPARPPFPPDDAPTYFADVPGAPIGLRGAREVLTTGAPTAWRLAAAEYDRLLDRLHPPGVP